MLDAYSVPVAAGQICPAMSAKSKCCYPELARLHLVCIAVAHIIPGRIAFLAPLGFRSFRTAADAIAQWVEAVQ